MTQDPAVHSDGDMPEQCIMFDREHPKAPFYLRIATPNGCDHVELEDANGAAKSLPAAVAICVRDGYDPTHYHESGGRLNAIPEAVVRRPASPARTKS